MHMKVLTRSVNTSPPLCAQPRTIFIIFCGSSLSILINVTVHLHVENEATPSISTDLWRHRVVSLCHCNFNSKCFFFFFFLLFFLRPGENALEDKFIILSRYEMKDERSHIQYTYFNAHSIHCRVSPHMVLIALLKL